MIRCINQATVMKADTLRFIQSAGNHGFSLIELDIDRLVEAINKDGISKVRAGLRDAGVQVVSLNAIDNYPILGESEMTASLARAEQVVALGNKVDSDILVVNPANFRTATEKKKIEEHFDAFIDQVAAYAEKNGVRIGYEYVSYDDKVVNTLEKTIEALGRWNDSIELVLDVFHMYRSGETILDLPPKFKQKLLAFHVSDAPSIQIGNLVDTDRVFPLDGVIGVQDYIRDLRSLDYEGPISVELFNHKFWDADLDEVLRLARDSLDRLLGP
jgi:2-keto-myo-inositol isomerase